MRAQPFLILLFSAACVSNTPAGAKVRITSNPDVVKGCAFLGNVTATSGWGGASGTGLGTSNTEATLQNKTAQLGGNVLFVVSAGLHAAGEAYQCEPGSKNHVVAGLEPGVKLFGGDGSFLGTVRSTVGEDAIIELTNGTAMRMNQKQALALSKNPPASK